MDIDELRALLERYRVEAQQKLAQATKAMSEDDFEKAVSLQDEADTLITKANAVDSQIKKLEAVKSLAAVKVGNQTNVQDDEPVVLPLDGNDVNQLAGDAPFTKAAPEIDAVKSINVLRFGDMNAAIKAVATDLYGPNYLSLRAEQMDNFVKFIRHGNLRFTADEMRLAKQLILRPDVIEAAIRSGSEVKSVKADLQEMVNDLGGYLVPEDYRVQIISRLMGLTAVRQNALVITTNRDAVEWPKLEGGGSQYTSAVRVTWVDETPSDATVAATNPTFGMLRIPVYTVMARTDISQNLLEDSAFNILDVLARLFAEAMAIDEDNQFLTGRGGGTPSGVLAGGTVLSPAPDEGVQEAVTGETSTLTSDGIFDLVYKLDTQYRRNAKFMFAKNTIRDLRKLKDGESRYMWQESLQAGEPAQLVGYTTAETESMPAVAANAYPIVFGDWGGYLIADRIGMSVKRVEDTTTVGTNKVAIFARRRLGGGVIEPWRFAAQKVATS